MIITSTTRNRGQHHHYTGSIYSKGSQGLIGSSGISSNHSPIVLAIGDGANDVGMINEARVGVGISGGKEGEIT